MGLDRLDGEEMFPTDKQVDREVRKLYDTEYADALRTIDGPTGKGVHGTMCSLPA